ncbi:uncharacterized protein LOC134206542 [Armigeres subalbatus]|uniref:uncharacterized protein LOC134206542 n=1 Tax=Armigeres subalbatus TaxID=124917 RepID=UPI002ED577A9
MAIISGMMSCRLDVIGALLLMLCCCFSYAQGGCLSYGHSCWGGHGKRSGPPSGRSIPRSLPVPPMVPADMWSTVERSKAPEGKGTFYAAPNDIYYQPLGRVVKAPPVSLVDLLGADSSSSTSIENDDVSSKSDDDENNAEPNLNDHGVSQSREDLLRQRQLRRKAALFETASGGTGSSNEEDVGQLLLDVAIQDRKKGDLIKFLNATPFRKLDRST